MEALLGLPMPVQETDTTLILKIASGDDAALQSLYSAYGQRLYAHALYLTGDPTSAEEAVQETLIAVWQGAKRFRGEGRVIAWLLGITSHKALNILRRRVDQSLPDGGPGLPEPADPAPSPVESAARADANRLVQAAAARLTPEHRAVLDLVFFQGLSLAETAEVCGCPVGTVKSRLSAAKTSLRGALQRSGLSREELL